MSVEVDVEGYLCDSADWSEAWATALAKQQDLELTEEHWVVIRFMRDFLDQHQLIPDARFVMRHLSDSTGAARNRLFELFPYGYVGQACKIAGMRRPRAWSTG